MVPPPSDGDLAGTTSERLSFWRRLFGSSADAVAEPEPPPLFRPRPLPPPAPKGPGLPDWEDILSEAPPPPDPERQPRLVVVASQPPPPEPPPPGHRPLTESERRALTQITGLLESGQAAKAAELVEASFAERLDACDARGRPIYLVEALRCALLIGQPGPVQALMAKLRPLLPADDPLIEMLFARAALQLQDRAAARLAWRAALQRAPNLTEAVDWLARNPLSPDGGIPALALVPADGGAGPLKLVPPLPLAPPPAAPVALPGALPARLVMRAALAVAPQGGVLLGTDARLWESARDVPGAVASDLALVLGHPEGIGQPHAFQEVLLAALAIQRSYLPHLRPARLYAGRQSWAMPAVPGAAPSHAVQAEMLAVLFPDLKVVADHEGTIREAAVLLVDGGKHDSETGTLLGGLLPLLGDWVAEARGRACAAFDLPASAEPPRQEGRRHHALFLPAAPPRTLAEPVRARLFGLLANAGYEVASVDLSALPWHRQVRLAYGADLIIGVHGPAMSPILWAHPHTRIIELFPEGCRQYEGQVLAEAAGLSYLGVEGVMDGGFVARGGERSGPPVGKANRLVWALPWALLEQAVALPARR